MTQPFQIKKNENTFVIKHKFYFIGDARNTIIIINIIICVSHGYKNYIFSIDNG
jgi:hypothetical protein